MPDYRALLITSSVAAVLLASTAAHAEDAPAVTTDDARERGDIIVTGLATDDGQNVVAGGGAMGAKKLLDTPYSVTVINAEDISKRQATTIGQIFINDPSVSSFATAGTTNWWGTQIRGMGVRNYYIDDVPLILYWGGDFPLEPIETVEALKGLSGFMYGFGAPGGVISYRTKRPTQAPLLTTEIGYRNNSVFYGMIDAGGRLSADDKLGYRINVGGEKGTAYNKAGVNRYVGSLALDYQVTPDLKWYATGTYQYSNLKHEPFQIYWSQYADGTLPKPTYDYDNLNVANSFYRTKTLATATGLDWGFAKNWSARLTYGYTSKLHNSNKMFIYMQNKAGDYLGVPYNFAELDQNHFAQAMVQGSFDTGPLRHEIVTGLTFQAVNSFFGSYYWGEDEPGGTFTGNIYQPQPFRVTRDLVFSTKGSPSKERQRAAFLSDTLRLGNHFQAMIGGRYTKYELLDLDGDPATDSGYRTSAFTPTFALIYKPTPYVSVYGSYVESLEGGTRVGGEYANVGEVLKATVSKQYEFGVKYDHDGLSLTTAAFRVERVNQADRFVEGVSQPYLTQDGLTIYKGIEAIASYRITEDFRFGLGAVHLDPRISAASDPSLSGKVPSEAAKWQVTANADYAIAAVPGLSLHGNVRYFGKAPTSDDNSLYIPARTLANAGFEYETAIGGRKVAFTGNLNNLFNKKYWGQSNIGEEANGSVSVRIYW